MKVRYDTNVEAARFTFTNTHARTHTQLKSLSGNAECHCLSVQLPGCRIERHATLTFT